jgi:hypothetical protein
MHCRTERGTSGSDNLKNIEHSNARVGVHYMACVPLTTFAKEVEHRARLSSISSIVHTNHSYLRGPTIGGESASGKTLSTPHGGSGPRSTGASQPTRVPSAPVT